MPATAVYMVSDKVDRFPEAHAQIEWMRARVPSADPTDTDLVLAFGGDGEILKAYQTYPDKYLMGIRIEDKMSLGFYAATTCNALCERLVERIQTENFDVLEFPVLKVTRNGALPLHTLNDANVIRDPNGKSGKFKIEVGEDFFWSQGDGIILATPSGSSGYNFSSGGGIVSWDLFAYCLRAFNLTRGLRSISYVVPGEVVTRVTSEYAAVLELDGVGTPLPAGTAVEAQLCARRAKIVALEYHGQLERIKRMIASTSIEW